MQGDLQSLSLEPGAGKGLGAPGALQANGAKRPGNAARAVFWIAGSKPEDAIVGKPRSALLAATEGERFWAT